MSLNIQNSSKCSQCDSYLFINCWEIKFLGVKTEMKPNRVELNLVTPYKGIFHTGLAHRILFIIQHILNQRTKMILSLFCSFVYNCSKEESEPLASEIIIRVTYYFSKKPAI